MYDTISDTGGKDLNNAIETNKTIVQYECLGTRRYMNSDLLKQIKQQQQDSTMAAQKTDNPRRIAPTPCDIFDFDCSRR